jgi:mannose-6-phosphate isomerase
LTLNPRITERPQATSVAARRFHDRPEARAAYRAWLFDKALPLWWRQGADHEHGGFHDNLDEALRPVRRLRRARVQCRQVFSYAVAHELGWPGPWRAAAEHGWSFFERAHTRPDGLFRDTTSVEGSVVDDAAHLYEQAFALLALAALERNGLGDGSHRARASRLLSALAPFRHAGGYREVGAQPFQSNAQMHLLEACLAWAELGEPDFAGVAAELVELATGRLIDVEAGFLREVFDADWRPAPGAAGEAVEPGHQFEWAWLLARWARHAGDPKAQAQATRLFAAGTAGVDATRPAVVAEVGPDLRIREPRARLWAQTEYLRAASLLGEEAHLLTAAAALWRYLRRDPEGLWWDWQSPGGAFDPEPAPASSFYHIVGACRELLAPTTEGPRD